MQFDEGKTSQDEWMSLFLKFHFSEIYYHGSFSLCDFRLPSSHFFTSVQLVTWLMDAAEFLQLKKGAEIQKK